MTSENEIIRKLTKQRKQLAKLNGKQVVVGAFKSVPEHTKEEMAEIVRINEFGTSKIPARSFLRGTIHKNRKHGWRFAGKEAVKGIISGRISAIGAYEAIGSRMVEDVHHQIDTIGPDNAPSTIAKKGRNQPLIDTGGLYRSIDKKVINR